MEVPIIEQHSKPMKGSEELQDHWQFEVARTYLEIPVVLKLLQVAEGIKRVSSLPPPKYAVSSMITTTLVWGHWLDYPLDYYPLCVPLPWLEVALEGPLQSQLAPTK